MLARRPWSPQSTRLLQLAATLLAVLYMLLIGGTFDATVRFRVQLLNAAAGAGLGLLWLAWRLARRQQWLRTGLEWPLLIFALTQGVAVVTAVQPRLSLEPLASLAAWSVALLVLYDLLAHGWPREYVENALIIGAAILAADGLWSAVQWYAGWARLGQLPPVTLRFYGLFTDPNFTACVINLLLPFAIARGIKSRAWARLGWAALAGGLGVTEFFTSSRAGWISCGVMLTVFVILLLVNAETKRILLGLAERWRRAGRPIQWGTFAGGLIAVAAGGWLLVKQSQHITHLSLFESRQLFWSVAWDLFKSRPLTGIGPDLFNWVYSRYVSIPPGFFAPHAHSLPLQILNGSGLLGIGGLALLVVAFGARLRPAWLVRSFPVATAAGLAGLAGFAVHHLFDYLLGTPFLPFLLVVVVALVLASLPAEQPSAEAGPAWLAPALLVPIGIFAFALNAAQWNDAGQQLAARSDWAGAAAAFERAGQADPGLTLYWEEAAYARARSGEASAALALWLRAERDDPYWAVIPASVGALSQDAAQAAAQAAAARQLAPRSYLFALNAGAIDEARDDVATAQAAYLAALDLNSASAGALYWQQSALRQSVLASWLSAQPADDSARGQGQQALASGAADRAVSLFQQAIAHNPNDTAAYQGLGRAYLDLHDDALAERVARAGLAVPVDYLSETLGLHLLAGDVAQARGDQAGAANEYAMVFSAIDDYNVNGPGTYGYTNRSWQVFRRAALPAELIPQLPRADITADMDQRFAQLAQWYRAGGQPDLACEILRRVYREAPQSISGQQYRAGCA